MRPAAYQDELMIAARECRYEVSPSLEFVRTWFRVDSAPPVWAPRQTIAPGQDAPVLRVRAGERVIEVMRWGLLPQWAKLARDWRTAFAPSEIVGTRPSLRAAFCSGRRCLVPAVAHYAWVENGGCKRIFRVVRSNDLPLAFAGLWSPSPPHTSSMVARFALITAPAPIAVREVCHRMPIILAGDDHDLWLKGSADAARTLLRPYEVDPLTAVEVPPEHTGSSMELPS
jgi:putative SOS response-associated peptidase YedK